MDFVATITDYAHDQATQGVWAWVKTALGDIDGLTYYRAPLFGTVNEPLADWEALTATNSSTSAELRRRDALFLWKVSLNS